MRDSTYKSTECLGWNSRRIRRRRGEGQVLNFAVECETALTKVQSVWGGIRIGSRTPLVFPHGHLNAQVYIEEVLGPVILPRK
ncbi:hypothetical protein QE152_g37727 [Popillia japonica]|uniref:Uncharacterized protein n=1 Tax=Popillia japonica TaxID=7064 RepID=A0AAW1I9Z3_POPJA